MKKTLFRLLLINFLISSELTVAQQSRTDSLLQEVQVNGFSKGETVLQQSAAITYLQPKDYQYFSQVNPVMAWNSLPGVNLEQRAIGSYRINLRGSSLRAPFGVRDVKVYWNGIPFTEANGSTALNLLSMDQMQRLEVIKGPAGSLYGAGLGGVIHLSNFAPSNLSPLRLQFTVGSYGRYQANINGLLSHERSKTYYSINHNQTGGYRDHNALNRQVYQLSHQIQFNDNNQIQFHGLFSDLYYEIPGGLNQDQFDEDPIQARAGSAEQNASIDQRTALLGINYLGYINNSLSHSTNIGYTLTHFQNPFILDYKEDDNNEVALRHQWTYLQKLERLTWQLDAGLEYQYANNDAFNFGNVNGEKDTVRFKDNLIIDRKTFFGQFQIAVGKFKTTLGLSSNLLTYEVDRYENAFADSFRFRRSFNNELIPRLAIQYAWNDFQTTFASMSEGFSSPSLDEIRTNEGSISRELEAEKGTSFELGHKIYTSRLQLDASVFYSKLDETITTFTNRDGVVLFQNSGATDQRGFEIGLRAVLFKNLDGLFTAINSRTSYQFYDFTFQNYSKRENDFTGNRLTGVPQHTFNQILTTEIASQIHFTIHYRFVSEVPLTDANDVYVGAYHLVNLNLRKEFYLWDLKWSLGGGIENVLNEKYSLGNDLNAFGGRYFQPAPDRNFYLSLGLTL